MYDVVGSTRMHGDLVNPLGGLRRGDSVSVTVCGRHRTDSNCMSTAGWSKWKLNIPFAFK
jgi:hypothetical protein